MITDRLEVVGITIVVEVMDSTRAKISNIIPNKLA